MKRGLLVLPLVTEIRSEMLLLLHLKLQAFCFSGWE